MDNNEQTVQEEVNNELNQEKETTAAKVESTETQAESALPADEKTEVSKLEEQIAVLNDRFLRLYSEFDNFRKRTAKEKLELGKSAGEEFFKAVLPVLDDFERGLKAMNDAQDIAALKEGVDLIYNKFKSTLTNKGLESFNSSGEVFNADFHEAITNIPAPSEDMKGKVMDELEKGYSLNGKVIRFAKVIVGA